MPMGLFAHVRNQTRGALCVGNLGSRGGLRSVWLEDMNFPHRSDRALRELRSVVVPLFSIAICEFLAFKRTDAANGELWRG